MEPRTPGLRPGPVVPRLEARLRELLDDGRWRVGEQLPNEAALARLLGVGRSSVREAVRLLVRDGLLDVRHGVGTFVTDPATRPPAPPGEVRELLRQARLLEVYEVRRALEVEAARLAAERATPAELRALRERLVDRQARRTLSAPAFVEADLAFHLAIVELAANSVLLDLFTAVLPVLRTALVELVESEPQLPDTSCAHAALLSALEARDAEAAVTATLHNLEAVVRLLRAQESRLTHSPSHASHA
ncbi:FadR/GntR family transcriptional regulator [Kitasatospora kifunensis]|uniref:DNA-binding FadR family transcriptional regulator n=1 Tax=Kitasatospora kifunensis TaxID=58351 RepID=A0A7W7R400_KITKI|nr:FCD domain-containing protein [Kitasatospora kifunensis]MBB4924951.1 DNA-binding FadR family transcriptional regulator [Kitasatospora kifunensis]